MNWADIDPYFDRFTSTVFRLETLQDYTAPGEAEAIAAFRRGDPLPERSVRTEPWLARIAVSTVAEGKQWQRVRVVEEPLTDYTQYELAAYVESQAAGEEIRIARSAPLRRDFWLFDAGLPGECALLMHYSPAGEWEGAEVVTDAAVLAEFRDERGLAMRWSVPLNEYLAEQARRAA